MMEGRERLSSEETLKKAGTLQLGRKKANTMVVYKTEEAVDQVTLSFTWSPGYLFTCKLLFTTSYSAGAKRHMMEPMGPQLKTKKTKWFFTQRAWDLWGWLSWAAVWADGVGEGEGKFMNNSSMQILEGPGRDVPTNACLVQLQARVRC